MNVDIDSEAGVSSEKANNASVECVKKTFENEDVERTASTLSIDNESITRDDSWSASSPYPNNDTTRSEEEQEEEQPEKEEERNNCRTRIIIKHIFQTNADWWSLWIGLASFALAMAAVFCLADFQQRQRQSTQVIPQPLPWSTNPLDAWNVYNLVATPILLMLLGALYGISLYCMGRLEPQREEDAFRPIVYSYMTGFAFMAVLAVLSLWMGRNEWASAHGLGYAVWAIALGMLMANGTSLPERFSCLLRTAKDGEFFIKCSLVLLAVELNVLVSVGGPAMLVAWIGSPVAIFAGFYGGVTLFHCRDSLAMLIAVGASWCGASAMSAVAPIVAATSEEVSLAISVVAFFTVIFTFLQPYLAKAVGLSDEVAGAWIGGSVDQTGNVVVSAAIISDKATEVASIVKMVLNAGLGVMASAISCYWNTRRTDQEETKPFSPILLWEKFPKFTLGFLITSAILTLLTRTLEEGTAEAEALSGAVLTLNKWWFAIAFVGIGLTTNVMKL